MEADMPGPEIEIWYFISNPEASIYYLPFGLVAHISVGCLTLQARFPHSGGAGDFVLLWQLRFTEHDFEGSDCGGLQGSWPEEVKPLQVHPRPAALNP